VASAEVVKVDTKVAPSAAPMEVAMMAVTVAVRTVAVRVAASADWGAVAVKVPELMEAAKVVMRVVVRTVAVRVVARVGMGAAEVMAPEKVVEVTGKVKAAKTAPATPEAGEATVVAAVMVLVGEEKVVAEATVAVMAAQVMGAAKATVVPVAVLAMEKRVTEEAKLQMATMADKVKALEAYQVAVATVAVASLAVAVLELVCMPTDNLRCGTHHPDMPP